MTWNSVTASLQISVSNCDWWCLLNYNSEEKESEQEKDSSVNLEEILIREVDDRFLKTQIKMILISH